MDAIGRIVALALKTPHPTRVQRLVEVPVRRLDHGDVEPGRRRSRLAAVARPAAPPPMITTSCAGRGSRTPGPVRRGFAARVEARFSASRS